MQNNYNHEKYNSSKSTRENIQENVTRHEISDDIERDNQEKRDNRSDKYERIENKKYDFRNDQSKF